MCHGKGKDLPDEPIFSKIEGFEYTKRWVCGKWLFWVDLLVITVSVIEWPDRNTVISVSTELYNSKTTKMQKNYGGFRFRALNARKLRSLRSSVAKRWRPPKTPKLLNFSGFPKLRSNQWFWVYLSVDNDSFGAFINHVRGHWSV